MSDFPKIFSMIYNQISSDVDYNTFREMLIKYSEDIMNTFLKGKANCICYIGPLDSKGSENYDEETNTYIIRINEDVVRKIYNSHGGMFVVFHEITHVYDEFCIKNKIFDDSNLRKICIENGIRKVMPDGNYFYAINYKSVAIEAHANLIGVQLTKDFYKKCNVRLNSDEEKGFLLREFISLQTLNNPGRENEILFEETFNNKTTPSLNEIVLGIMVEYPDLYEKLKDYVGEEYLLLEEEQTTDFEKRLYSDDAIFEANDIISNPLFESLVEEKTQHRPKV